MFILMIEDLYESMITVVAFASEEEALTALAKWEQGVPTGIGEVDSERMSYCERRTEGVVLNASGASKGRPQVLRAY